MVTTSHAVDVMRRVYDCWMHAIHSLFPVDGTEALSGLYEGSQPQNRFARVKRSPPKRSNSVELFDISTIKEHDKFADRGRNYLPLSDLIRAFNSLLSTVATKLDRPEFLLFALREERSFPVVSLTYSLDAKNAAPEKVPGIQFNYDLPLCAVGTPQSYFNSFFTDRQRVFIDAAQNAAARLLNPDLCLVKDDACRKIFTNCQLRGLVTLYYFNQLGYAATTDECLLADPGCAKRKNWFDQLIKAPVHAVAQKLLEVLGEEALEPFLKFFSPERVFEFRHQLSQAMRPEVYWLGLKAPSPTQRAAELPAESTNKFIVHGKPSVPVRQPLWLPINRKVTAKLTHETVKRLFVRIANDVEHLYPKNTLHTRVTVELDYSPLWALPSHEIQVAMLKGATSRPFAPRVVGGHVHLLAESRGLRSNTGVFRPPNSLNMFAPSCLGPNPTDDKYTDLLTALTKHELLDECVEPSHESVVVQETVLRLKLLQAYSEELNTHKPAFPPVGTVDVEHDKNLLLYFAVNTLPPMEVGSDRHTYGCDLVAHSGVCNFMF
eukprot:gnl/Spiro4/25524_TR12725_c0_g1_i1.p1 gnl/Spiro4/25524_TR12725_c0_g1~~gnl/Spiro4/25524_TR12725_c0_g1_i1.p1  ORF type:complete len:548 (-),score=85.58 gnl/Spiro4/25524_TR12725_c0_g1_i1:57-1700(-)